MSSTRPLVAVLLAGSCGLVAACGSSSSGGPATQLKTAAQAKTFATDVNLKPADLPGFKASPADTESASDKQQDAQLAACSGGVDPSKQLADVTSDNFDRGSDLSEQEINSETTVLPTTADVHQDFVALTSAKGQQCLSTALGKLLTSEGGDGVTFGAPKLTQQALTVPGADSAVKFHVTLAATTPVGNINTDIDVLDFAQGQAEVQLFTFSLSSPLDDATEQGLANLLAARVGGNAKATPPAIPAASPTTATS